MTDDATTRAPLGWPVEDDVDGPVLCTGQVVDVLEVPYAAGLLAAHWWQRVGGRRDDVRFIPALPDPERGLVVAATAGSFWFVVQAGLCPWPYGDAPTARLHRERSELPTVRWHGPGGRVPLPPSPGIAWVHPPHDESHPPNPLDLVELLTRAVGALHPGLAALVLNGACIIPAGGIPDTGELPLPTPPPPRRRVPAGFYL